MIKELTTIKQIPDEFAEASGLSKYNRSRMPRCFDRLSPAIHKDGRFITGLDEDSVEINTISNIEERLERKEEIKNLRESLEKNTGLDLSGLSSYWKTYNVVIESDNDLILDPYNPHDIIKYMVLTSNGYVAPSKEDTGLFKYKDAKYYAFFQETANKQDVSTQKLRDQARSELYKLMDKKDSMVLIGRYLEGAKYTNKLDSDTIYSYLSSYIDKSKDNVKSFLNVVAKSHEDLQFKTTVDLAIRLKKIKFKDDYYQRGQITLGKTVEEVYKTLKSPEFAAEFLSIQNELQDRD
jgi:hypothetical protein